METYILKTKDFGEIIEQTYYKKQDRIFKGGHSTEEEKQKASRSRAVSKIKEAVYCNNFKYFFTLTIKDDTRFDIEKSMKMIVNSINYYKKLAKNNGFDFRFVYVFELTKNKGVHLHRLF